MSKFTTIAIGCLAGVACVMLLSRCEVERSELTTNVRLKELKLAMEAREACMRLGGSVVMIPQSLAFHCIGPKTEAPVAKPDP